MKPAEKQKPDVAALVHRVYKCPAVFLQPPKTGTRGMIHVDAVARDLLYDMTGSPAPPRDLKPFSATLPAEAPWLQVVLVALWLLHDPFFLERPHLAGPALAFLDTPLKRLSSVVAAHEIVNEPDRREELVRLCLNALNLLPENETANRARDRLNALDSVERARVIAEAKKAEEHARKVREAMKRKKAKEAAAKVMRE